MRPSKRDDILDAAFRVVAAGGVSAATFEAVSDESGISRGGLLYHFATKEELLIALHEHLAARWESQLIDALGTTPDRATETQRLAAYAQVSARSARTADLLLMIEASLHPQLSRPYADVSARWLPDTTAIAVDDAAALDRLIAVLAADGLWASESIGELRISPTLRSAIADRITERLVDRSE